MKKSATSNYAGFIRVDPPSKKSSPSVKVSKNGEPTSKKEIISSKKNAENVYTAKISTTKFETKSQSNSSSSSKTKTTVDKTKEKTIKKVTDEKFNKPKESKSIKSEVRKSSTRTKQDINSIIDETKMKFKTINENLVQSEIESPRNKNKKVNSTKLITSPIKINSHDSISHTEQFENTFEIKQSYTEQNDKIKNAEVTKNQDELLDYEDDFEDYESDFESFSSSLNETDTDSETKDEINENNSYENESFETKILNQNLNNENNLLKVSKNVEEEKKLDSGVYELTMLEKRQRNEMQNIKKAIEEENLKLNTRSKDINSNSYPHEDNADDSSLDLSNRFTFINFEEALRLENNKRKNVKRKKRSDYLFEMIKLDQVSFIVYECPPIPYEVYIKCYGRSNTQQVLIQTNEDNLHEENQTEDIETKTKWTQCPISFNLTQVRTVDRLKTECCGVGEGHESDVVKTKDLDVRFIHNENLYKFINSVGQIILSILEEENYSNQSENNFPSEIFETKSRDMKISDQFVNLNINGISFLKQRSITHTMFCKRNESKLITVHKKQFSKEFPELLNRYILCQWNMSQPSTPLNIMVANSDVTCVDYTNENLVFAGMKDGSLSLWDLKEKIINFNHGNNIRSPSYNTASVIKENASKSFAVVSLQMIYRNEESSLNASDSNELCSLDENGKISIWTIFRSLIKYNMENSNVDLGQSYWGDIRLILLKSINVNDNLRFLELHLTCFSVFNEDIFIGTSKGFLYHTSLISSNCIPSTYVANTEEQLAVTCIEQCPFEKDYFLVGFSNGQIKFYNKKRENPLISFAGTGNAGDLSVNINFVKWSKHRLGLFFVLDTKARLHIWDLCRSDMYPLFSISLESMNVINLDLSPNFCDNNQSSYMMLGSSNGNVEIHRIKKEFGKQTEIEFRKDKNKFLKYVSIL